MISSQELAVPVSNQDVSARSAAAPVPNIAWRLRTMAQLQPDLPALCVPHAKRPQQDRTLTFAQLERATDGMAAQLTERQIVAGTTTVVMVPPGQTFVALTYALFKIGAVPVFVDPGLGLRRIAKVLEPLAPSAFVGVRRAQVARSLFGWGRQSVQHTWTVETQLPAEASTSDAATPQERWQIHQPKPRETAAVLFTSGSTGAPKGVIATHDMLQAQVQALMDMLSCERGERELATFPLFALLAPALGLTCILPPMNFARPAQVDPKMLLGVMEAWQANSVFASPAVLRRLSQCVDPSGSAPERNTAGADTAPLRRLKRVVTAGAPAPLEALRAIDSVLEGGARVHTPYGATEGLPLTSIDSRTILSETALRTRSGAGVCVGCPLPGVTLHIVPTTDHPIPHWQRTLALPPEHIGEVVVAGAMVSRQYAYMPAADAMAKIVDSDTDTIHHRMGDLGYLDARGRLWLVGRKAHRVETESATLHPLCCEGIFNAHPWVERTALVAARVRGKIVPVLCVETRGQRNWQSRWSLLTSGKLGLGRSKVMSTPPTPSRAQLADALLKLGAQFATSRPVKHILFHPQLPVDVRHNAKIDREALERWASRRLR